MTTKLTLPAAVAALLAGVSLANAAAMTETATISSIDKVTPLITMQDGTVKTFWLARNFNLANLKAGQKVTITYDMENGRPTATAIVAAN
jgi:Cu/Ag efflux protein CusF